MSLFMKNSRNNNNAKIQSGKNLKNSGVLEQAYGDEFVYY